MLTMLLVDDEYLVRKGITETIEWDEYNIRIVGEAANGVQGLEMVKAFNPDIVLTDIKMPVMDGLDFMSKLKENNFNPSIIILSGYEDFNYARNAIQNGALAYLLKPIDNDQLIETVQQVASKILSSRKDKQLMEELKSELPSITKQFLFDLITGNLNDKDKITEKVTFLNIPFDINNCYVISVTIDEYKNLLKESSNEDLIRLKDFVSSYVTKVFQCNKNFKSSSISKSDDEFVIFIHINEDMENHVAVIKDSCIELMNKLKEEFNETISIGISSLCEDVSEMYGKYKEAFISSHTKIFPGSSSVVYVRELPSQSYRREIRDAINYIKSNYNKDLTVDIASKELFISPSHLMHLLKKELGKTFNECLTDYRIAMAKEFLLNPKYKIYEVSTMVGYTDVKYFSQVFKKNTGMTPSEYIKIHI